MKEKFGDFKELSQKVRVPYPGENRTRQAPEEHQAAEFHNMVQLFNKISQIMEDSCAARKSSEESARAIDSKWSDIRGMISDMNIRINALVEAVSKIPVAASLKDEVEVALEVAVKKRKKKGLQEAIMLIMEDGKERHIHQLGLELKALDDEGWGDMSIYSTCAILATQMKLNKIRKGIYVLRKAENNAPATQQ